MIDLSQFRLLVIRPTLQNLSAAIPYSLPTGLAAENLLIGTALHESENFTYLAQVGGGPALGWWQMEPATFDDCWENYIKFRPALLECITALCPPRPAVAQDMVTNLALACAMARVKYARDPSPLPDAGDAVALCAEYLRVYNSILGAATMDQTLPAFQTAIAA